MANQQQTTTLFVAGPSLIYTRTGADATWEFLGMAESDTTLQLSPEYEDVYIDGGGFRCPFDKQFMGAMGSLSFDLVKFNGNVLGRTRNWVNQQDRTPGVWPSGTIGSLLRTEDSAFGLCVLSYYGGKDAYQGFGMMPAIVAPFAVPLPTSENLSTRTKRVRCAWDIIPVLDGLGGGTLFTTDVADLNLPDPS